MRTLWRWLKVSAVLLLVLSAIYLGYRALVGWPSSPMTVIQAEWLFSKAVKPGNSVEEVRNWLISQSIPDSRNTNDVFHTVHYDLDRRPEGGNLSTDQHTNRTVAELAGLQNEDVHSIIRVQYPEADRFPLGCWTAITVYIFFSAEGRAIRYWIHENEFGPGGTPKYTNLNVLFVFTSAPTNQGFAPAPLPAVEKLTAEDAEERRGK
jgi:hypothetical protein